MGTAGAVEEENHQVSESVWEGIEMTFVELGSVANVSWGDTSTTKKSYVDSGYQAFSATGPDGFLPEFDFDQSGLVLSAIGARCGKCFKATGRWKAIKNTITITTPRESKLDINYLYYIANDEDFWPKRGMAQPFIGLGDARKVKIPLPPLAEQKRIAAILDAADALKAKRRDTLAQLDPLIQSTFHEMFINPVRNSDIPSATINTMVYKFIDYRGKSPEKSTKGIPLITAKIVKEKEVKAPNEFIPTDSYDAWMRRGIPKPGDVIITTEAPMGEVALVPEFKAAFAQRLLILQPNRTKVDSVYIMWALTAPFVTCQLQQRSTGSTVTGIRSSEFKKISLPLPPLPLQRRFAAIVESVEQQKTRLRAHLTELDTLFASLQHRAFNGEL